MIEETINEVVSNYLEGKDLSELDTILELNKWAIGFCKHLGEIRPMPYVVETVMDAVRENTGEYWEEFVKPVFRA